MSEMVERVRKAIEIEIRKRGPNEPFEPYIQRASIAAVHAMLEPTEAMLQAAARERKDGEKRNGHGLHAYRDEYRAMIDAALTTP